MRDVLKEAYDQCLPNTSKWVGPDKTRGESLEAFQSVLHAAKLMEDEGLIVVQEVHRESQTAARHADRIKFLRVK